MDFKYEVTVVPVSDVDRAKEFYGERAGLIARTVDEGPPLAVSYALTERGNALLPALAQISLWSQEHLLQDEG